MKYGILTPVALAAAVLAATAVGASAQVPGTQFQASYERVNLPRAAELESRAAELRADAGKWNDAASMLRDAARLRPGNDPVALIDLQNAGLMYSNTRSYVKAQDTLLELARRASDFGEVKVAADALIDAAFAAVRRGQSELARDYLERAERLANSSHLDLEDQQQLATRLHPPER
jgi:tetratricopeptide (TPR) repeat protein